MNQKTSINKTIKKLNKKAFCHKNKVSKKGTSNQNNKGMARSRFTEIPVYTKLVNPSPVYYVSGVSIIHLLCY